MKATKRKGKKPLSEGPVVGFLYPDTTRITKREKDTLDAECSGKKFPHAPKKTTVATQCALTRPDFIISATHTPNKQIQ